MYISTGLPVSTLDSGVFDNFDQYWIIYPELAIALFSLPFRLLTEPSLVPLRAITLVFGFILLGAAFGTAKRLGGYSAGILSVVVVELSVTFLHGSHLARTDIIAAALCYLSFFLYTLNKERLLLNSFLQGLLIGLAFENHAYAVIFGPAIVVWYLVDRGLAALRHRDFYACIFGGLSGVALYAAAHILPNPESYAALQKIAFVGSHEPPILSFSLQRILQHTSDQLIFFSGVASPLPYFFAAVSILLLRRRSYYPLLAACLLMASSFVLLLGNLGHYYFILLTPALDIMLACALVDMWRCSGTQLIAKFLFAITLGTYGASLYQSFGHLRMTAKNSYQDFLRVNQELGTCIKPGEVIIGPQTYWFEFFKHTYYSWEGLVYYRRYKPDSSLDDAIAHFSPNIIIIDGHFRIFLRDPKDHERLFAHLAVSKPALEHYLQQHAEHICGIPSLDYGMIDVYRIEQGTPPSAIDDKALPFSNESPER